jgi:hypothetical protein
MMDKKSVGIQNKIFGALRQAYFHTKGGGGCEQYKCFTSQK